MNLFFFPVISIAASLVTAGCNSSLVSPHALDKKNQPLIKLTPAKKMNPLTKLTPAVKCYKVRFDTRGLSSDYEPLSIAHGNTIDAANLPRPAHPSWDFSGWFKDKYSTIQWDTASDTVTSDITLYAKWDIKTIQPQDLWESRRTAGPDNYYRIPALVETCEGMLIAFTDLRYNHSADIGKFGGQGEWGKTDVIHRVDLTVKRSTNHGFTWDTGQNITDAPANPVRYGYGDAAVVADSDSPDVLVLCAHGDTRFGHYAAGNTNTRLKTVKIRSLDGGQTFTPPVEITDQIYGLNGNWGTLFFGSGKIMQSRRIKQGSYYRIYAAILAKKTTTDLFGNAVLYSDDFGDTWQILGNVHTSPIPNGDEAKIEELPDGRVLLSSRTANGRIFNIFRYTDESLGTGSWENAQTAALGTERGTNGEITIVKARKSDTKEVVYLALQSIPLSSRRHPKGGGEPDIRTDVGIYWRVIDPTISLSDLAAAGVWKKYQVFNGESGYSTMVMQKDHRIGFLYEKYEGNTRLGDMNDVYDIRYESLPIRTITGGAYEAAFLSE